MFTKAIVALVGAIALGIGGYFYYTSLDSHSGPTCPSRNASSACCVEEEDCCAATSACCATESKAVLACEEGTEAEVLVVVPRVVE
jgi:hypothetical protein